MILSPHRAQIRIEHGRVVSDRKKVAIVAFSQTAGAVEMFIEDPAWEIWGLNNGYELPFYYDRQRRLRTERWFEMHPVSVQPANDLHWLHACPVPIYVLDLNDPVPGGYSPHAVQFPLAECEALFPKMPPFWASTFAYQVALAILEGFTDIALLGLDMGTPREWLFERPNLLFWAGYAAGRGVKLTWPTTSTVFQHGGMAGVSLHAEQRPLRYGYDYHAECDWCQLWVDYLMQCWGYVERPEAQARRLAHDQRVREAIAR